MDNPGEDDMDDVDTLLANAWKNAGAQQSQTELDLATALRDLAVEHTTLRNTLQHHLVARVRDLEHRAHQHQEDSAAFQRQQRLHQAATSMEDAAEAAEMARELRRVLDLFT